jgi:hypothetical protein
MGAREDVVDVGARLVVAEERLAEIAVRGLEQRSQVVGGGRDRVLGVVDVVAPVVVAVHRVALPRGRRPVGEVELHGACAAAEPVDAGAHARRLGAAVVGLDRADPREHLPRHFVTVPGVPVQREVALRDVPLGIGTGLGLDGGATAAVRAEDGGEHTCEGHDE